MITWRLKGRIASNGVWEDIRHHMDEHSYQAMNRIYVLRFEDNRKIPTENRFYDAYALVRTEEVELWVEEL